jgi:hypothetical protein
MPSRLPKPGDGIEMAREHPLKWYMLTVGGKLCREPLCP